MGQTWCRRLWFIKGIILLCLKLDSGMPRGVLYKLYFFLRVSHVADGGHMWLTRNHVWRTTGILLFIIPSFHPYAHATNTFIFFGYVDTIKYWRVPSETRSIHYIYVLIRPKGWLKNKTIKSPWSYMLLWRQ